MLFPIDYPPATGKLRHRKVVVKQAKDGQWYVVEIASNGEDTVVSETYKRRRSAIDSAIRYCQVNRDLYEEVE
jgi:uncharacterized protein YegP (UPF0339 family)